MTKNIRQSDKKTAGGKKGRNTEITGVQRKGSLEKV